MASNAFSLSPLDLQLMQYPWKEEIQTNRLVLEGACAAAVSNLIKTNPNAFDRVALLAKQFKCRGIYLNPKDYLNKARQMFIASSMAPTNQPEARTMTQLSTVNGDDNFLWHAGVLDDSIRPTLDRMRTSTTPMGLVMPYLHEGLLKTIQMCINPASIQVFGFDKSSVEDMMAAIMRDTSGDWYLPDLEEKRVKYQHEGTSWEQVARIKSKDEGYFLMHFRCQRIENSNLVLSWGSKESEVVERPELLRV